MDIASCASVYELKFKLIVLKNKSEKIAHCLTEKNT